MRLSLSELSGFCINPNPSPCSLLASVSRIVWAFVLNGFIMRGEVSSFFVSRKSASSGSCNVNAVIFLRCVVQWVRTEMKLASWFASPRNALSSVLCLLLGAWT